MLRSGLTVALLGVIPAFVLIAHAADHGADPAKQQQAVKAYGQLPLSFTANQGQYDPAVAFETGGSGYAISFTRHEAIFNLTRSVQRHADATSRQLQPSSAVEPDTNAGVHMQFAGAAGDVKISGIDELPGKANFLIGSEPSNWRTGVPTYRKVKYTALYPGIDLVYYGNQKQLEFDFIVQPGADTSAVKLDFGSAMVSERVALKINESGDLLIGERGEEIKLPKPTVYQTGDEHSASGRHIIDADYVLYGHQVSFYVGPYDKTKPLVIDPSVVYSTFIEGIQGAGSVAVDDAGNAYLAAPVILPPPPNSNVNSFGVSIDKLNPTGTALLYSTIFAALPNNGPYPSGMAIDTAGDVFIAGTARSNAFPTTPGAFRSTGEDGDSFVAKLDPAGAKVLYSTYLPYTTVRGIAIDSSGHAYVSGYSYDYRLRFVTTPGAYQTTPGKLPLATLTKFDTTGSSLVYSTYLGEGSYGGALRVDTAGNAFLLGSGKVPVTPGALSTTDPNSYLDGAYLAKFDPDGSKLIYSTLLAAGSALAIDPSGNAYVTGEIYSQGTSLPTTPGVFQEVPRGDDAFVMKINPTGTSSIYASYLGGGGSEFGSNISVDAQGNAYIAGVTTSTDFPTTQGAFQSSYGGGNLDGFLTVFNPTGSALVYSSYLGGNANDQPTGLAIDRSGGAYIAGYTNSAATFPTTPGAYSNSPPTEGGGFLTKFQVPVDTGKAGQSITFPLLPNQIYGVGPITLTARASSGLPISYSATGPVAVQGNILTVEGAGAITVTASQTGDSTYSAATPLTRSFTVATRVLDVKADDVLRNAGTPNPALSYTVTGFVNGDTPAVFFGHLTETTTATIASSPGSYPITFSERFTAKNYSIRYLPGTLTVNPPLCQAVQVYAGGFYAYNLSLNNGAKIKGNLLQLTDGGIFEARSAFFATPVLITDFVTDFTFQVLNPIADGFTFALQSNNAKAVGHSGGDLGYTGIPNSAAVKFDLHNNKGEGQGSMGFYQGGVPPTVPDVNLVPRGIDLHSGHIFLVHIAYVSPNIAVTITDTNTHATTTVTFQADLRKTIGTSAFYGFTAGTGEKTATQDILNWSFAGGPGCSDAPLIR